MARILVVDDDRDARAAIRRILEQEGHQVVEAPDGVIALHVYREQPADLVICDIFMPETDGVETTVQLLQNHPEAKIVAISGGGYGFEGQQMLRSAERLGAVRTLAKPFERTELLAVVEEVLGGK